MMIPAWAPVCFCIEFAFPSIWFWVPLTCARWPLALRRDQEAPKYTEENRNNYAKANTIKHITIKTAYRQADKQTNKTKPTTNNNIQHTTHTNKE